jgi:cytidine deaminase
MKEEKIITTIHVYQSINELSDDDKSLLLMSQKVAEDAYAPYSNFKVGAAAKLINGAIITGTNQENASYPVGICAERVLLSTVASIHPNIAVETIAISYHNLNGISNHPVSPCGICRQSLVEYEERMHHAIRLILSGQEGKVFIIPDASLLLPLQFKPSDIL